ncbi:DUF397 domain-containing protein [Amycolatopsis sp. WAC 04182]|uniref:DUF397 domain-containing protein n=1 Tax=Amycolatopsis sp. WAC 04182 TaxID=2203198 RepID=UPI000F776995|nr:DUF397 domain-containing protein [Amycolatopsis sp. WAC 04182]RSN65398.1 DUF397 domain-containing protein [Amycolatopsis sp. WAC 04182]
MTELRWRKSSYSGGANEECVEVGFLAGVPVAIRDSKDPEGGQLTLSPAAFAGLLASVIKEKDGKE